MYSGYSIDNIVLQLHLVLQALEPPVPSVVVKLRDVK